MPSWTSPSLRSSGGRWGGHEASLGAEHDVIAATFLLGPASGRLVVGHNGSSDLLPDPQRGLCLPEAKGECLAGLPVGEDVLAGETGLLLQPQKHLLASMTNCVVVEVLRCTVEDPYAHEHAITLPG